MASDPIIKEQQIKIILDTNIEGQSTFPFTKNVLQGDGLNSGGFSEYPYFSSAFLYPERELNKLTYNDQVAFFFNKSKFLEKMKETEEYKKELKKIEEEKSEEIKYYKEELERREKGGKRRKKSLIQKGKPEKTVIEKKKSIEKKNSIVKENIMLMLKIIFPTNYPISDNVFNSHDSLFAGVISIPKKSFSTMFSSFISNFTKTSNVYSYINVGTKGLCTVTKIMWVNDLYNHPDYKDIVDKYKEFVGWKIKQSISEELIFEKKMKEFKKTYEAGLNELKKALEIIKNPTKYFAQQSNHVYIQNKYTVETINLVEEFNNAKEHLNKIVRSMSSNDINDINVSDLVRFKRSFILIKSHIKLDAVSNEMKISELLNDIDSVEILNEVIEEYLNNTKIQMGSRETEKKETKLFVDKEQEILDARIRRHWDGYSTYKEFATFIKKFVIPNMESSNAFLQNEFENFYKNKTNSIVDMIEPDKSTSTELIPSIDTGITLKSNVPEIYVRIDVIAGKLDNTNMSKIECAFLGEYLGNEFTRLTSKPKNTNFWELEKNRFFFDLKDLKNKTPVESETKNTPPLKTGGKSKYRSKQYYVSKKRNKKYKRKYTQKKYCTHKNK
jgi:hypothetical protein